jgi:hypothetical protein
MEYGPTDVRGQIERKTWCMVPYAGVDYNLTLYVHSKVDFNTFTMGNPMPESTLSTLCHSRLCPSDRDFGFGLGSCTICCIMRLSEKRGGEAVICLYCKISQKINATANAVDVVGVFSTNFLSLATAKPLPTRQKKTNKRGKEIGLITLSAKSLKWVQRWQKKRDFFISSCATGKTLYNKDDFFQHRC